VIEKGIKDKQEKWVRYEGPRGGRGWKNIETGEILYQEEKPSDATPTMEAGRPGDKVADTILNYMRENPETPSGITDTLIQYAKDNASEIGIKETDVNRIYNATNDWTDAEPRQLRRLASSRRKTIKKWKKYYWEAISKIAVPASDNPEILDGMEKENKEMIIKIGHAIKATGGRGVRIYRGMKISKNVLNRVIREKRAELILNSVDSWSVDASVAAAFASYPGGTRLRSGETPIVLEYEASPEEIITGWPIAGYETELEMAMDTLTKGQKYKVVKVENTEIDDTYVTKITIRHAEMEKENAEYPALDGTGINDPALHRKKPKKGQ
jgi:hypothetical protein